MERKVFQIQGQDFVVQERFEVTKEIGHGAYGIVCAARRKNNGIYEYCAIKKVTNIMSRKILAKRALREIKILSHLRGHRNITKLYDLDVLYYNTFNEIYLYEELMEADLHAIIRSRQPLTDAHFQSFIYQILCGLKYIHSANILHRDLKSGNLLVNADCELKICDFGLSRGFNSNPEDNTGFMTEYVATRWYRAPEIMLSNQTYTTAVDVWSVGCILAELLGRKPIFKGRDYVDQMNQILYILGTPDEEALSHISSQRAQEYLRSLSFIHKKKFAELYPDANPLGLELLEKMLKFDPARRISVDEALEHPYLSAWHDPNCITVCEKPFDFDFDNVNSLPKIKSMIYDQIQEFRSQVRSEPAWKFGLQGGTEHPPFGNFYTDKVEEEKKTTDCGCEKSSQSIKSM